MTGEFEKHLRQMNLDKEVVSEILEVLGSAGSEFPCLTCPSKDECNNFKWFVKWFGETKPRPTSEIIH